MEYSNEKVDLERYLGKGPSYLTEDYHRVLEQLVLEDDLAAIAALGSSYVNFGNTRDRGLKLLEVASAKKHLEAMYVLSQFELKNQINIDQAISRLEEIGGFYRPAAKELCYFFSELGAPCYDYYSNEKKYKYWLKVKKDLRKSNAKKV